MDTLKDFEDMLIILGRYRVKYLIIGGLAFIYHAKPRYTKDMDLLICSNPDNVKRANLALAEFGCPHVLDVKKTDEIIQIGLPPNRIDILLKIPDVKFETAWKKRIKGYYGRAKANWIDLDSLIQAKRHLQNPRHQEDVRILLEIKRKRDRTGKF
ncbi:MAG: hypothetical protein NT106_03500 [Candidatus Sumerlaeota bacterium]|nr:hypothetical protein [Candidatus Sumerlaeota bacterium]